HRTTLAFATPRRLTRRILLPAIAALLLAWTLAATARAHSATTVFARPVAAALDPVPNPTSTPVSTSSSSTPLRHARRQIQSGRPVRAYARATRADGTPVGRQQWRSGGRHARFREPADRGVQR